MLRLGFREIRNAMNPSRKSVADTEIGLYGTKTQGEIAESREPGKERDSNEEPIRSFSNPGDMSQQFQAIRAGQEVRQDNASQSMEAQQKDRETGREM